MTENTINQLDAITEKMNYYYQALTSLYQQLSNKPDYKIAQNSDEILALIEDVLRFVRDNEVMTSPINIPVGARFRADTYNDMIDSIAIDLQVAFARMRAMVDVLNGTAMLVNGRTYGLLSEIDEMTDKIANLGTLTTTNNQYDDVVYDTFITDNNSLTDSDYKTMHQESGGIITIQDTYSDIIVERRENFNIYIEPLNLNAIKRVFSDNLTANNMIEAFDISLYSYKYLYLTDYEIGEDTDGEAVPINFNGATVGIIMQLPSVKFINNISCKFAASGLLEVVDLYYSRESAVNMTDYSWNKIEFSIDQNNLRGTSINFSTIEAGSVMIILGQKSVVKTTTTPEKGLSSFDRADSYKLSELTDHIQKNANLVTKDKIKEYASPNVVKTLSDDTAKTINAIILQLEDMLPPEDADLTNTDMATNYVDIYEYNFSIYDFRVNYIHFNDNSVFRSPKYGGNGNISDIILSATQNIPDDTMVCHYIELLNGEHRILPQGTTTIKDILTITDTTKYDYTTDLLVYSPSDKDLLEAAVEMTINGIALSVWNVDLGIYNYMMNKLDDDEDVAYGFRFGSHISLNFGDTVVFEYSIPETDLKGKTYDPYSINIEKALGNPIIIDQTLDNGNQRRMLIENQDDSYTSYEIPTESVMKLFPASGETIKPEIAFEIHSGIVKDDLNTIFPPYETTVNQGYAISGEYGRMGSKTIYYGVLDESTTASGETSFTTAYEYIPGTLHASYKGKAINVTEYDTDPNSEIGHLDKDTFTTDFGIVGSVVASYMPASLDQDIQESNMAQHNYNQIFQGTDRDSTVTLDFYTHIDMNIARSSLNPGSYWTHSLGVFINKANENIVYSPINVRIDGRLIVNKTDYLKGTYPDEDEFRFVGTNYQYYVKGKKVIFNTVINRQLDISYYMMDDTFRLLSKLYRTNRKVDDITPEMYGFALYMNKKE